MERNTRVARDLEDTQHAGGASSETRATRVIHLLLVFAEISVYPQSCTTLTFHTVSFLLDRTCTALQSRQVHWCRDRWGFWSRLWCPGSCLSLEAHLWSLALSEAPTRLTRRINNKALLTGLQKKTLELEANSFQSASPQLGLKVISTTEERATFGTRSQPQDGPR